MKYILLVLSLVCVGFVSCDGRNSRSESLKTSVAEFKERQSKIVIVTYYPKDYTEVVTDTLLSNKVKVHIKNYSLSDESILMSFDDMAVPRNEKQHRIFKSEVVISIPSKVIFDIQISAEQFKFQYPGEFWNHATLQHVWVNQELSTSTDVKLDMSFIDPTDYSFKLYRMSIDANGKQQIDLIEERT